MARKQSTDFDKRREAILDRAADLFARDGFQGASVADLSVACGISKSLIYHYYPSKEDILCAVMSSHIDQLVEDVDDAMLEAVSQRGRLRALLRRFMAHYAGAASRQKVLLNELERLPDDARTAIVAKQRRIIEKVQSLVVAIRPAAADAPAEPRVVTMLLFGMINWTGTWFDPDGAMKPVEIAELAFKLIAGDDPAHEVATRDAGITPVPEPKKKQKLARRRQ